MINEMFVNAVPIIRENDVPPRNEINVVDIRCTKCNRVVSLKVFRAPFLVSPYVCISCVKRGHHNPFYGHHHSDESKLRIGGAIHNYSGSHNPFYQKTHSNEVIEAMRINPNCVRFGERNGFFGKHHSETSREIIKIKNKEFRNSNPEIILQNKLRRVGKSKEDFELMLNEYLLPSMNRTQLSKKHGVDFRTMKSYWIFYRMITQSDLTKLTKYKQLFSNPSYPEKKLYDLLRQEYGTEKVCHCYEIDGYYYDICLFGKLLIEYDGYYWHKMRPNNDMKKNNLAAAHGYILYRVEERHNRIADFTSAMEDIKTLLRKELLIP